MPGELPDSVSGGDGIDNASDKGDAMAKLSIIEGAMDEAFSERHNALQQVLVKFQDGSGYVAQESKQLFQLERMQYTAAAIQQLEQDGLSARITQLKASGVFPNYLPSGGNVFTVPTGGGTP